MTLPSVNAIGGALAIAALAVVLYLGFRQVSAPAALGPAVSTVAPIKHAPLLLRRPAIRPKPEPKRPEPKLEPKRPEPKPAPKAPPKPVYHKVLPGGKLDGKVDCKWVPEVARQFSKDQVLAAAQQYGLSPAQVSALRVCLN